MKKNNYNFSSASRMQHKILIVFSPGSKIIWTLRQKMVKLPIVVRDFADK